ncbi:MAG TPA: DNA polymerase/3'-5' exonuclease PolX [Bacteroidetes bacterium]|nr:DNA polymerase/3'-5' exonuclease PolX [Bacteroidota bacterium]
MTNKEIANTFKLLGDIMELHGENKFKIRSYANAYLSLRKLGTPLSEISDEELNGIKGIGKAISGKIKELLETGEMATLKKYQEMTPPGIQQMLQIKGFGPKKIRAIWKGLGIETVGELLYACNENRLVELKGFGQKTQEDLRQKLEYFQKSKGKYRFADLESEANEVLAFIQSHLLRRSERTPMESPSGPQAKTSLAGAVRRRNNVVEKIEIAVGAEGDISNIFADEKLVLQKQEGNAFTAVTDSGTRAVIYQCAPAEFGSKLFRYSAGGDFLQAFLEKTKGIDFKNLPTEAAVFEKAGLPFIEPEMREQGWAIDLAAAGKLPVLVEEGDIKGVVHAHSTYSDGLNSLREMAEHSKNLGYEYLGISDHSKAAFYANGLKEDRLEQQWAEIDELNKELAPFKIFKSIECDILSDGSLDYDEATLEKFDFVIASVHSNLKMDGAKATARILKAVENPHTYILGHPTGRLLLSRLGYPLDHQKIIDACAANRVAIELNANPYRLDLDWSWIPYALEKGVLISINPDAHSTGGINDIHFGVLSARKGGLSAGQCLTCFGLAEFSAWVAGK